MKLTPLSDLMEGKQKTESRRKDNAGDNWIKLLPGEVMNNFNMSYLTSVNTSSDNLGEEMIVKLFISVSVQKEMIIKTDNQMEMRNMLRE
jgi:hypothetical protein